MTYLHAPSKVCVCAPGCCTILLQKTATVLLEGYSLLKKHLNEIKNGGDRVGRFDVGLTQEGSALD